MKTYFSSKFIVLLVVFMGFSFSNANAEKIDVLKSNEKTCEQRFEQVRSNIKSLLNQSRVAIDSRLEIKPSATAEEAMNSLIEAEAALIAGKEHIAKQKFRSARRMMLNYAETLETLKDAKVIPESTTNPLIGIALDSVNSIGNCCPKGECCCTCQCGGTPRTCICNCSAEITIE
jgi:hypothetical protein